MNKESNHEFSQEELDGIAEQFSMATRRGEQPTVEEYLAKHHDASGQLRELLNSIQLIEGLKQQTTLNDSLTRRDDSTPIAMEGIEDYEILREIGRGGMGVVFEAVHQSLGRTVAIKVLAENLLGEAKHLARFKTEARAAARLRHSNIVPVFGVGSTESHHYYVMDFIDGQSLRERISDLAKDKRTQVEDCSKTQQFETGELDLSFGPTPIDSAGTTKHSACTTKHDAYATVLKSPAPTEPSKTMLKNRLMSPSYFRWVSEIGVSISDALEYAHSKQVLHRDIKPANLLIDSQEQIWIADFGLAKIAEQQTVTKTGEVVGTPQYMPPESFEGQYDARSEIYGVGLTLYEMLTLQPAIVGMNAADTVRKAIAGDHVPASQLNDSVPKDLETIVMKCLEHDRSARYETAADLRDDLRRFLDDRAITARRVGLVERGYRWTQREPVVACLTLSTFLLLSALALVSAFGYFRTKSALSNARELRKEAVESQTRTEQALDSKSKALQLADEQRTLAKNNLQTALSAFDSLMDNVANRGLDFDSEFDGEITDRTAANVSPQDAELLRTLLVFFDELAANNSDGLKDEAAKAACRAGDIYVSLGQLREADDVYSEACQRYRLLCRQFPDDLELKARFAEVLNKLATVSGVRGQINRANSVFDQTRDLLVDHILAIPLQPVDFELGFQFARAHRLRASLGSRLGLASTDRPLNGIGKPAFSAKRRNGVSRGVIQRSLQDYDSILTAIDTLENLDMHQDDPGRNQEAGIDFAQSIELARCYRNKSEIASRVGRDKEAETAAKIAIDQLTDLLSDTSYKKYSLANRNRRNEILRYELAQTLVQSSFNNSTQLSRMERAQNLIDGLLDSSPERPNYRDLEAQCQLRFAELARSSEDFEAAENYYWRAIRIYTDLLQDSPELRTYQSRRARCLAAIAELKIAQGDTDNAKALLRRAIGRLQSRSSKGPKTKLSRSLSERLELQLKAIEKADIEGKVP